MEKGPLFYVVIQGKWRSNHLQVKGSTFISQLFKDNGYWSGLIWSQESTKIMPVLPDQWSQNCLHLNLNTVNSCLADTLIIQTKVKSPAKINDRCLTEIDSCYYGLLLKRILTQGPYSVHYKSYKIILPLAFGHFLNNTVQFSLWLTSIQWHAKNYTSKIH